jgi:dihydropteroate synthase
MILQVAQDRVLWELQNIGTHIAGVKIMAKKSKIFPLKVLHVRTPAANIIKQEMLACGGDCAVPADTVTCAKDYCDIVLLGTLKHYSIVCAKLKATGCFGLDKLAGELETLLAFSKPVTRLADGRELHYEKTMVMGIINVTPDSFFAGSRVAKLENIVQAAGKMLKDGADILDIGGESTRPGADSVSPQEEIDRVVPAIQAIRAAYPASIISIDTYHSGTAEAALLAGADILNDISAGEADEKMAQIALKYQAPIILMHMRGTPKNMQKNTTYENVVDEVAEYLLKRAEVMLTLGLNRKQIILDPGIGFAKDKAANLELMQGLVALTGHGYPILLAASRKTTIGKVLGDLPPEERLEGTMATSCQAVYAGVDMVRVHDVKENTRIIRMLEAILQCR